MYLLVIIFTYILLLYCFTCFNCLSFVFLDELILINIVFIYLCYFVYCLFTLCHIFIYIASIINMNHIYKTILCYHENIFRSVNRTGFYHYVSVHIILHPNLCFILKVAGCIYVPILYVLLYINFKHNGSGKSHLYFCHLVTFFV